VPSNDADTQYRIIRQSLISSATRLYQNDPDPDKVLEVAREWEKWIYEPLPAGYVTPVPNGTVTPTSAPASGPAPVALVCAECGNPLTPVTFKAKGTSWSAEHLAQQGLSKYGQVLCKAHYFGKKPV